MKLTYHRNGDYLYPNLVVDEDTTEIIGKYGLLRKAYLRENRTNWYKSMLLSGKLNCHLEEINRTAQAHVVLLLEQLLQLNPAPDKEIDQLGWLVHMNGLTAMAEEIVLREIIYC